MTRMDGRKDNGPLKMKRQNRRPLKAGRPAVVSDKQEKVGRGDHLPFYVVGLGASAGGLDALNTFFSAMPPASGMAFVVVQHLSPDYKSQLVALLKRRTSMPVVQITDGMAVRANHVHVIPPNKCMVIFQGKLLLAPFPRGAGLKLPIDHFFMALAQDQAERGIAISLSGTGSDGARGVRAVKEAGGLVIVQDECSALFNGMPHSAIATGMADCILPPAEMPAFLRRFVNHPLLAPPRFNRWSPPEGALEKMSALIRAQTGVDFTHYKRSTLVRRLERRMGISQIENFDHYLEFLQQTPDELAALKTDLLISVTRFFRDAEAFRVLKATVIPALFAGAEKEQSIRVWVPGCATGEEVYSIAMLLQEHAAMLAVDYSIKVFATDVNAAAVNFAGTGRYPAGVAMDVPAELLAKYFTQEGDAYRVHRHLREKVVFATQNLLRDPPFTRVNLISCRNLLIYLQTARQHKVFALFHFALQPQGYLFLGSSETVGERQNAFESVDSKARIYRKLSSDSLVPPTAVLHPSWVVPALERVNPLSGAPRQEALRETIHANLLADFVPTCFAVNEQNEVLYSFGQPGNFTALPTGPAQLNLLKLVPRTVAGTLNAALSRARKESGVVSYRGVKWKGRDTTRLLQLTVKPMPAAAEGPSVLLVFLEEVNARPVAVGAGDAPPSPFTDDHVAALEQELLTTRQDLQTAMHTQQASHEELQSINEELIAANEELQSGNEELESINEELSTLNFEYQRKNEELLVSNNDLENLLRTAEIGTIFLDATLRIRKFTPVAAEELNLLAGDADRLLTDLSHPLLRELAKAAQQAMAEKRATELIVEAQGRSWYLLRVSPYSREGASEHGAVATILNVSRLRQPSVFLSDNKTESIEVCGVKKTNPTQRCASKRKK
ncbi:MAG TPA: chemotaxis protein CheB [Chthoniobacterales bacterium]